MEKDKIKNSQRKTQLALTYKKRYVDSLITGKLKLKLLTYQFSPIKRTPTTKNPEFDSTPLLVKL